MSLTLVSQPSPDFLRVRTAPRSQIFWIKPIPSISFPSNQTAATKREYLLLFNLQLYCKCLTTCQIIFVVKNKMSKLQKRYSRILRGAPNRNERNRAQDVQLHTNEKSAATCRKDFLKHGWMKIFRNQPLCWYFMTLVK